jgi:hypothetical protein
VRQFWGQVGVAGSNVVGRGPLVKRPMRTDVVVGALPPREGLAEGSKGEISIVVVIELFEMGPVSPLNATVELGGEGRQDKELHAAALASLLEPSLEFRASIDLDRLDGEARPGGSPGGIPCRTLSRKPAAAEAVA